MHELEQYKVTSNTNCNACAHKEVIMEAIELAKDFFQDVIDAEFEAEIATGKKYLVITRAVKVRVELTKDNKPKIQGRIKK